MADFGTLPLNMIDAGDKTYQIWPVFSPQSLLESVRRMGIRTPIWVQKRSSRSHRVICGFRRLAAAQALSLDSIPCMIRSDSESELFYLSVSDQMADDGLDALRLSYAIQYAHQKLGLNREEIVQSLFPALGLGRNPRLYRLYEPLVRHDEDWQDALRKGILSEELAAMVVDESEHLRQTWLHWIRECGLNRNRQREFWSLLRDVAARERRSIEKVMSDRDVVDTIQQTRLTAAQKADRLKAILKRRRYPRLQDCEDAFTKVLKDAKLPTGVSLKHSPFFEGEHYTLSVNFKGEKDFDQLLHHLQWLKTSGVIKRLESLA